MRQTLREILLAGRVLRAKVALQWTLYHYNEARINVAKATDAHDRAVCAFAIHTAPPQVELPQYLLRRTA